MATDDIVLLLVCCLIEVGTSGGESGSGGESNGAGGDGASFLADLAFVKAFHFCEDSTSAVYFALSTFEVSGFVREYRCLLNPPPARTECTIATAPDASWLATSVHSPKVPHVE